MSFSYFVLPGALDSGQKTIKVITLKRHGLTVTLFIFVTL